MIAGKFWDAGWQDAFVPRVLPGDIIKGYITKYDLNKCKLPIDQRKLVRKIASSHFECSRVYSNLLEKGIHESQIVYKRCVYTVKLSLKAYCE